VLIDGRSGSGKTELARALVEEWPVAQLLRLDDFYPGWHGLAAGSRAVPGILTGLRWQAWDWAADRPGAWHQLDPERPVVVEGVGAVSRASRALADLAVWVELDDDTRKHRALERDGDAFAPHWDAWAAQELEFIGREHPREFADLLVDGREATAAVGRILVELPS
jgi:uridine kinase